MTERQAMETEFGQLQGRDCIHLDELRFLNRTNLLELVGSVNTSLCSAAAEGSPDFIGFRLVFDGLLATQVIDQESWQGETLSSFDELTSSPWLTSLGNKVTPTHRHFVVQTYDDVVEVVCKLYRLDFIEQIAFVDS